MTIAESGNYLAFPDVAITKQGVLVCCYLEGDQHSPTWSQIVVKRSTDLGLTWSDPQVVARSARSDGGFCWNCPRLSVLPDGTLVLLCDYEDNSRERAIWAWRSPDEGRSWSEPRLLMKRGLVPDRVVATPSGRLLLAVPCQEEGLLLFSSSNGVAWREVAPIRPMVEPRSAESSLVVLDEARMVCYTRGGDSAPGWKSISLDGGHTWDDCAMTCFAGHRPCGGVLRSGNVLVTFRLVNVGTCAYIESPASAVDPEYKTQHGSIFLVESARSNYFWDYGYSGWAQLPDDRILCVYHTKRPTDTFPCPRETPVIRSVVFTEADFPSRI
jgi:hypothetical protein